MTRITLIIIILFTNTVYSQTYINDKQSVYGTWTKSKSPYIILGEATVPQGETLIIKKGVEVKFKTGTERIYRQNGFRNQNFDLGFLRVNGTIIAKGSKEERVIFTGFGPGYWGSIIIETKSNASNFKYCTFTNGYYIKSIFNKNNSTGVLTFYNSYAVVEYCTFMNNGWAAINCKEKSSPQLKNLTIVKNYYALECNSNSEPIIENCIIWKNIISLYINEDSKPKISYSLLQDIKIDEIYDAGNNILNENPEFEDENFNNFLLKENSPCIYSDKNYNNMGSE